MPSVSDSASGSVVHSCLKLTAPLRRAAIPAREFLNWVEYKIKTESDKSQPYRSPSGSLKTKHEARSTKHASNLPFAGGVGAEADRAAGRGLRQEIRDGMLGKGAFHERHRVVQFAVER